MDEADLHERRLFNPEWMIHGKDSIMSVGEALASHAGKSYLCVQSWFRGRTPTVPQAFRAVWSCAGWR